MKIPKEKTNQYWVKKKREEGEEKKSMKTVVMEKKN